MSDYLSASDLFELTGRKQRPAQIDWLKRNRWRYVVSDRGDPRVLRAYRDKRLLDSNEVATDIVRPDFSGLSRAA